MQEQQRSLVCVQETLLGITKIFEEEARSKGIKFDILVERGVLDEKFVSDERVLNQILFNLLKFCIY